MFLREKNFQVCFAFFLSLGGNIFDGSGEVEIKEIPDTSNIIQNISFKYSNIFEKKMCDAQSTIFYHGV